MSNHCASSERFRVMISLCLVETFAVTANAAVALARRTELQYRLLRVKTEKERIRIAALQKKTPASLLLVVEELFEFSVTVIDRLTAFIFNMPNMQPGTSFLAFTITLKKKKLNTEKIYEKSTSNTIQ